MIEQCTVIECELEAAPGRTLCAKHVRRAIDGLVFEDEGGLYDHCLKGHILIEATVRWESNGKRGKKRRRCLKCLRLKAQRQSELKLDVVEPPTPYRPADLTLSRAIDDFEEAKKRVTAKCQDSSEEWMDWDEAPTAAEAEKLCYGCPLAQACLNYAVAAEEWHGVWGGKIVERGVWL